MIQKGYGLISLFDGVPSVVDILKEKIGYPLVAILLAESDSLLRGLVRADYGYPSDGKLCRNIGSACIYLSGVNHLLEEDCEILKQAASLFPGIKWFFIRGTPCQGLTYTQALCKDSLA